MKKLKMKLKKISAMMLLSATIVTGIGSSVCAYSSYFSLSYNTYANGNGKVNGANNGRYYNLSNKNTYLRVTSKGGSGTITVSLIKGWFEHGTVYVSGRGSYGFGRVPSGKYHLEAFGGRANTHMSLSGNLTQ